jgi:hypothetical protein
VQQAAAAVLEPLVGLPAAQLLKAALVGQPSAAEDAVL